MGEKKREEKGEAREIQGEKESGEKSPRKENGRRGEQENLVGRRA